MKIGNILALAVLSAMLSTACNTTNNDTTDSEEKEGSSVRELLMNEHGWSLAKSEVTPSIAGKSDIYSDLDECDKDDIEYYKEGGLAVYDEGKTKCFPEAEQVITDRWMLLDDDSTLIIYSNNNIAMGDTFYVVSVSKFELVSTYKHIVGNTEYTFKDTYMVNKKGNQ